MDMKEINELAQDLKLRVEKLESEVINLKSENAETKIVISELKSDIKTLMQISQTSLDQVNKIVEKIVDGYIDEKKTEQTNKQENKKWWQSFSLQLFSAGGLGATITLIILKFFGLG